MSRSLAAVRARPRVTVLPAGSANAEYALDPDAIRGACELLGLTRPVLVCFTNSTRHDGLYTPTREHRISVHTHLSAYGASRVLWHELEHARQDESGERDPRGTKHLMRARTMDEYFAHPDEVAARAREAMADDHPLAH